MHRVAFTPEALGDLEAIRNFDARRIVAEIENQLTAHPGTPTKSRKRLRPNRLSEWELRVGEFRIFYDIVAAESLVRVVAIGRKVGNELFIHGERFDL